MQSMHWVRGRRGGTRGLVSQRAFHVVPEILGGAPVFVGTRVPVKALHDYLQAGHDLEEFLDDFPTVSRAQAVAALQEMKPAPDSRARPAG
jgi:uncharacterized protein (DUF433 family)